jgi:STE24 endopeptidase
MNAWLLIVLLILAISCALEVTVSILNIGALSPDLPDEFADVFAPEKYRRSQEYTRAQTYLTIVQATSSTLLTAGFIVFGGFHFLDIWTRSLAEEEIVIGLLFIGSTLLLSFLAGLPFSVYATFVVEERFGFNRTTGKTFIFDIVKGMGLTIVLGTPLLTLILWFFAHAGPYGWLFCWLGVVIFILVLQYLGPVLIMPLFNKFSPLPDGDLREAILDYAQRQNFTLRGIFTMDGSKRSAKVNAFFTGFGKYKKIVFFDTLIEKLRPQEIVAVLAHEMGHFKLHHILKNVVASVLQIGIMFYFLSLILHNRELSQAFGVEQGSLHASLVFFAFLYSPINLLVAVLFHIVSRRYEYAADAYAAETIGSCDPLISGLKKLSAANLANLTPHPWMVFLRYSHPPVLARITRLKLS